MRKLSALCLLFCLICPHQALSQNLTDGQNQTSRTMEYARQSFFQIELPLYSLYFLAKLPGYLGNTKEPLVEQIPSSLSFLEWTALVHLGLLLGSTYESQHLDSYPESGLLVPGWNSTNDTVLDQFIKADRELLMPIYGALVAGLKTCVASGVCGAQGTASFLIDQYFPLENVLIPILKVVRQSLNDGKDVPFENNTLVEQVAGFSDTLSLMPIGNTLFFSLGVAQLSAALQGAKNPGYGKISLIRAIYLVSYFSWIGVNNVPMLVDQTVRLSKFMMGFTPARTNQNEAGTGEIKKDL